MKFKFYKKKSILAKVESESPIFLADAFWSYKDISGDDIKSDTCWSYRVVSLQMRLHNRATVSSTIRYRTIRDWDLSNNTTFLRVLLNDNKNHEIQGANIPEVHCRNFIRSRHRVCCRQRDELQRQRQGPLRSGRCVPLRDSEGGIGPGSTGPRGQAELPEESASGPVPADRQQVGNETLWQQEGAHERTNQAKSRRSLGHPSLL